MPASRKKSDSEALPQVPAFVSEAVEAPVEAPAVVQAPQEEPPRPPRKRNEAPRETFIKFTTWFTVKAIEDSRLKAHRLNEIRAFMTASGLSAAEPRWRYEAALRSYFGT